MSKFVISCCSTADLSEEHFKERNISYICFHFELDGKEYPDDLGKSIPFDTFYQAMQDGAETKTSQINADEFEQYFEYVGKVKTTDKADLLKSFENFLNDPELYGGFFVVRWNENDTMYNTKSLDDFV